MSFILKNLYNTINSHVDNGNGIEYIITEDGFPRDGKLKRFSSLPKIPMLAGNRYEAVDASSHHNYSPYRALTDESSKR